MTTDQEYFRHPGFSQSIANELLSKSPLHAFHKRKRHLADPTTDPDHSRAREMGTVIHKLILGSTVGYLEHDADDWRTKAAKDFRADCESKGITPILRPDLERCRMSANAVREQLLEVFGIELDGLSERAIFWERHSLQCKAKLDHVRADEVTILDIKSGEDANPKRLIRRILECGYHVQAAAYVEALEYDAPRLAGHIRFIDVFIETSGLTMCTPVEIAGSLLELGSRQWDKACRRWQASQQAAQYDGYTTRVLQPPAPEWALKEEMQDE